MRKVSVAESRDEAVQERLWRGGRQGGGGAGGGAPRAPPPAGGMGIVHFVRDFLRNLFKTYIK